MKAKKKFLASSLGVLTALTAVNVHAKTPFKNLSTRENIMAGVTAGAVAIGITGTVFGVIAHLKSKEPQNSPESLDDGKIFELKFLRAYLEAKKRGLEAKDQGESDVAKSVTIILEGIERKLGNNKFSLDDNTILGLVEHLISSTGCAPLLPSRSVLDLVFDSSILKSEWDIAKINFSYNEFSRILNFL